MGYFNNGIGAARINDSSPSDYTTYSGNKIETKQNATDNTLTTTSKNIVGAINEINSKVNNKFIIAQTLPVSDIDEFAIYLIPKSTSQTDNIYDEYIYISTDTPAHWEKIGDTEIDLSGYYTSSQVDTLLNNKQDATDNSLSTTNKTVIGAINEVLTYAKNIANEYDDTATYAVGDFVTYMGVLYKCIVAISVAESWDSTHWDSTLIVEEFGGSGGASVTLGTTIPSDASGSNGDLYVQYDGTSYAAVYAYVKINNSWRKFPYAKVVALTQAEYDLITPDPTTLYIITDAQSSYQTKSDNSLATTDKTVVGAINEVNTALSLKLDKSKLHYGVGVTFDNNGVCSIDITSWGLSARPECVFATGCWAESSIITYDRTNSTATSLKFYCYDTTSQARRTGTNPFTYFVIV